MGLEKRFGPRSDQITGRQHIKGQLTFEVKWNQAAAKDTTWRDIQRSRAAEALKHGHSIWNDTVLIASEM
jgi:hypothetical protein